MSEEIQNPQTPQKPKKEHKPMGFWKTTMASMLGVVFAFIIFNIITFIIMMGMVAAVSSMTKDTTIVGNNLFLKVDMTNTIAEHADEDDPTALFSSDDAMGMDDILAAINGARDDSKISGIYLYLGSGSSADWAQSEEIRNALIDFKENGKPVVAYADTYTQQSLYLASVCDRISLHPAGMVEWRGIGGEVMFYKDLLDKLDVKIDLIRPQNNAYKSAGETYTMNHMSEANREQIRTYITSIWNHVVEQMAETRGIPADSLNAYADDLSAFLAEDAQARRMVDNLEFENGLKTFIKEKYDSKRMVSVTKYAKSIKKKESKDRIAIIYAEGNVVSGESDGFRKNVYGNDIAKALDKAAADKNVKAIVLRVNSPGGAVTASEIMTDAVMRAKKEKPLVVSMSGVAASAGYEISCNADCIVAQPTTITGSIGVFGTIPEIGDFLRNKLGITTDTVGTNRNSTGLSMMRPLSADARAMMQRNIEDFYKTFIGRVATGRNLKVEFVDSIARGRVWTGADALQIGLVDTLGGLYTAVSIAADKAGISDYTVKNYSVEKKWYDKLLNGDKTEEAKLRARINAIVPGYEDMYYWATMEPLQARLPYSIVIK
ncbi:MAG: signal peptide peptidase SppA [Bacteroidales bacterium]|nr:signal peptide peptidase SppA [Bacteroidales bacterium]